ncbi:MAG: hypothetical protein LBT89_12715 [Planctomycetaceae bacterium]|jgi:hypothetical protein|nr:hypothetical protein [Planctomycetaceae bacterium]
MKLCSLAKKTGKPCGLPHGGGKSLQITCEHSPTGCLRDCEGCGHFSAVEAAAPPKQYNAYGTSTISYRSVAAYNAYGRATGGCNCGGN